MGLNMSLSRGRSPLNRMADGNTAALQRWEGAEADYARAAAAAEARTLAARRAHIRALKTDPHKLVEALTTYLEEEPDHDALARLIATLALKGESGELLVSGRGDARGAALGIVEQACAYSAAYNVAEGEIEDPS